MGETCRFISRGKSYGAGLIKITQNGFETADESVIDFLRNNIGYGSFFFEVSSSAKLNSEIIAHAKALMAQTDDAEPIPVEPITPPDLAVEEKALEEEARAEKEDAVAEAILNEVKAEKRAYNQQRRDAASAKKTSKPKAAKGKK